MGFSDSDGQYGRAHKGPGPADEAHPNAWDQKSY